MPLGSTALGALKARIETQGGGPDALVWPDPRDAGPLVHWRFWDHVWKPALKAAELDPRIRIHDLRHTAVSVMAAAGVDVHVVSQIVGHSSVRTTWDRYLHLFEDATRDAMDRVETAVRAASAGSPDSWRRLGSPDGGVWKA